MVHSSVSPRRPQRGGGLRRQALLATAVVAALYTLLSLIFVGAAPFDPYGPDVTFWQQMLWLGLRYLHELAVFLEGFGVPVALTCVLFFLLLWMLLYGLSALYYRLTLPRGAW